MNHDIEALYDRLFSLDAKRPQSRQVPDMSPQEVTAEWDRLVGAYYTERGAANVEFRRACETATGDGWRRRHEEASIAHTAALKAAWDRLESAATELAQRASHRELGWGAVS